MDRELDKAATGPRWLLDERVARSVADTSIIASSHSVYMTYERGC
jgi:hypothetical protein